MQNKVSSGPDSWKFTLISHFHDWFIWYHPFLNVTALHVPSYKYEQNEVPANNQFKLWGKWDRQITNRSTNTGWMPDKHKMKSDITVNHCTVLHFTYLKPTTLWLCSDEVMARLWMTATGHTRYDYWYLNDRPQRMKVHYTSHSKQYSNTLLMMYDLLEEGSNSSTIIRGNIKVSSLILSW